MNIAVIGAGTAGTGIAHLCATAGHAVTVRDAEPNVVMDAIDTVTNRLEGDVDRGALTASEKDDALDALEGTTGLEAAVSEADLVVETVADDLDRKREVFADVEELVGSDVVIATTTASLSVSAIAAALKHPERAVGLHFFEPPAEMPLVEVVLADQTDDATADLATEFVDGLGKEAVVVTDTPGFATSRLGVALTVEAVRMVEDGVASVADVDAAMKLRYDHPAGPLELADRAGLDTQLDVCEHLAAELGDRFEPPALLRAKVDNGETGQKVGRGFYVWESDEPTAVAALDEYDVESVQ